MKKTLAGKESAWIGAKKKSIADLKGWASKQMGMAMKMKQASKDAPSDMGCDCGEADCPDCMGKKGMDKALFNK